MNPLPLRPQAGLVNAFAPTEVRSTVDDRLGQLAQGLSQFNRGLGAYVDVARDEAKKEAYEQAAQEHQQRQYKSIKDFDDAVNRGDISEDQNPWKMVFLRQLVARDQVRTGLLGLEDQFSTANDDETNAVRDSQSVQALDGWASSRIAELTKDFDPFSAAAAQDTIQEWKGNFLGKQQNQWERQRAIATDIGFRREFGHNLEPLAWATKAVGEQTDEFKASVDGAWTRTQQLLNNASLVTNPDQVRHNTMESLKAIAIASRSPEVLDEAMSRLTLNGKSLGDLALPGEVAEIHDAIERAVGEAYSRDRFMEKARDEAATDSVLNEWTAYAKQSRAAGQVPDPNTFAIKIGSLPAEQQVKVNQILDHITARDVERQVSGLMATQAPGSAGELTAVEHLLSSNLSGAREGAEMILRRREFMAKGVYPDVTPVSVLGSVNELVMDGTKSPSQKMTELNDLITRGQVSYNDSTRFQGMLMSLGRVGRDASGLTLSRYVEDTRNQLLNAALLDPEFADQRMLAQALGGSASLPEDIKNRIDSQVLAVTAAYERFMADNPQPMLSALEAELQKAQQQVLGPAKQENSSQAAGAIINAHNDPIGSIQSGHMVWAKDHFEVKAGEKTVPINTPRIFKNSGELIQNWKAAAEEAGIKSPDEQAHFLDKQITAMGLGPDETYKVFEAYKSDLWGPDVVKQAADFRELMNKTATSYLSLVAEHSEALQKGEKLISHGLGAMTWTYPKEVVAEYQKAVNEFQQLQLQVGVLKNGPKDLAAAQAAYQSIITRIQGLTPKNASSSPAFTGGFVPIN